MAIGIIDGEHKQEITQTHHQKKKALCHWYLGSQYPLFSGTVKEGRGKGGVGGREACSSSISWLQPCPLLEIINKKVTKRKMSGNA